jgi:hypothetical protein
VSLWCRWKDIIKMINKYRVGSDRLGSYDLRQKPVVASFKHSNKPSTSVRAGKFLTSWAPANFSKQTLLHEAGWSLPTQLLFILRMKMKKLFYVVFLAFR